MSTFLIDHALANIWCTPDQDNQVILKPVKITPDYGVWNSWKVMWTNLAMPIRGIKYHLYQIGQVHPLLIDLFPVKEKWTTLADACNLSKVICDIYLSNGIQLPRIDSWYFITDDKNIIIAVKENINIVFNPIVDSVYIRLYSNEYFNSIRANGEDNFTFVYGKTVNSTNDIISLQTEYHKKEILIGGVYAFCNGYKIRNISTLTVNIGDTVEFVYDSSIIKVVDFNVAALCTFDSALDNVGKYLLHYEGTDSGTIDYRDDIDIFIIDSVTQKGVYYHKNTDNSLRMVTHRDYSIPVDHVMTYLNEHTDVINPQNAYVRLHIRNSGYSRTYIDENNRIKELYKLNDEQINRALLGLDSTVDNWKAVTLENSAYSKSIGYKSKDINTALVSEAYGYNAVAKLVANTPVKTRIFNSQTIADLPYILQNNSTVFEFDSNRLLIGFTPNVAGSIYNCSNSNVSYVEAIMGLPGNVLDEYYNATTVNIDPRYDYRFYTKQNYQESANPIWQDVTGSGKYAIINNVATWIQPDLNETLVRNNAKCLVKEFNTVVSDGFFEFNITSLQTIYGVTLDEVMQVPMGELDIYLNGHYLIENLDYFVEFPAVTIISKNNYIGDPTVVEQNVVIKFTGLCDSNLNRTPPAEFGYVRNGIISNNNKYNIRDDKVISIYINGGIYTSDEVIFNENNPSFVLNNVLNGKPYLIKDTVIPIKDITERDTYIYRKSSLDIDKTISDYLTLKIPEVDPTTLNPILSKYVIYSPFICKILFDLRDGVLYDPTFKQHYDDDQIREIINRYLPILNVDPISIDKDVNSEYVIIHPHHLSNVISIDIYQYTFLNRVVGLYARGLVDLSPSVVISAAL